MRRARSGARSRVSRNVATSKYWRTVIHFGRPSRADQPATDARALRPANVVADGTWTDVARFPDAGRLRFGSGGRFWYWDRKSAFSASLSIRTGPRIRPTVVRPKPPSSTRAKRPKRESVLCYASHGALWRTIVTPREITRRPVGKKMESIRCKRALTCRNRAVITSRSSHQLFPFKYKKYKSYYSYVKG